MITNKKSIYIFSILVVAIIIGLGVYFFVFNKKEENNNSQQNNQQVNQGTIGQGVEEQQLITQQSIKIDTQKQGIIVSKEPKLTIEQKGIINSRLAEYQKELTDNKNLTNEQKLDFNLKVGFQYYALGQYLNAEKYYIEAEKYDFTSPAPYLALYQLYIDMNGKEEALSAINTAIKLRPGTPDYLKRRILLMQDKFSATNNEIDKLFQQALTETENNVDIITAYATFLEQIGDIQKAIEFWQKAGVENPTQKSVYDKEIERLQKLL